MLGTRGVRLGAVRPGVYQMQVRALCKAAANLFEQGKHPHVEIMIPLVVDAEEFRIARSWVRDTLDEIGHPEMKSTVVTFGVMIETPRAPRWSPARSPSTPTSSRSAPTTSPR